jgi:hypothetical protein
MLDPRDHLNRRQSVPHFDNIICLTSAIGSEVSGLGHRDAWGAVDLVCRLHNDYSQKEKRQDTYH